MNKFIWGNKYLIIKKQKLVSIKDCPDHASEMKMDKATVKH